MKRKRKTVNCVCSATPSGDVSVTDSILLNRIVENGMAQIKKTENPRKAAAMGLYLGDLCEKKGWSMRALDIWYLTINHVEDIDDRLTWGSWEEGPEGMKSFLPSDAISTTALQKKTAAR